ncbi:serine/threonine protein kinase [Trypanosoma theileri]|uniref:Serine/threonine protein kinase n=1 Tax=Trypanosoma theileri TaxID=67003 RepID=A0A1X0P7A3_9TRYP|nr:serine/threonine protein kinase [Trypanosoma theileri]ORC92814.1 serine/threonine protein kinase [Trypanosoma theileri]
MAGRTITSLCLLTEENPPPLFVGREDGTVEQYYSPDAASYGKPVLTFYGHSKTVTGIAAPSFEEVYTCSMDGTIRQWSTDTDQEHTKRCVQVSNLSTPLRCMAVHEGRIYAGGNDGCLYVIEGSRTSAWSGHKDALSCIAFGVEEGQLIITGGYDNHIRVWDANLGKTIRVLVGHQNHVKCLRVAAAGELLFSFGRDLTMRIWRLPELTDETDEEPQYTGGDSGRQATVSFREPAVTSRKSATEYTGSDSGPTATDEDSNDTKENKQESNSALEGETGKNDISAADLYRAAAKEAAKVKSALKVRPEPPIRQLKPVGTIEIPELPHLVTAMRDEAAYCFIGASDGYILGINARSLSKTVLQFLSRNTAKVRADTRETRQTLRLAINAIKKRCRKAIRDKKRELIRAAKKAKAAKKAEERKERAAARATARAEKAAARAAARAEDDEDEEYEEEEADEDEEYDSQEGQESGEDDEQQEEEEEDPLALLDDDQREELTTFRKAQEKERDDEILKLRTAAEKRNVEVGRIGSATFDTTRDQFFRLSFTNFKKIGGEAVQALALLPDGTCYAAQSDRVMRVDLTPGITYL